MNAFTGGTVIEISLPKKLIQEKEDNSMKKMIYSIAIVLMGFAAKANHLNSELVLDVYGNIMFTVGLDDRYYSRPDYRYHILDVEPGTHYLEVQTGGYHPYSYAHILFRGYIHIPAASKVVARIDRYGRFKILNVTPLCPIPVVYNNPPYPLPAQAPYYTPMSNYDFDMLRNSLESKSFESTRLQIAKQVLSQRFVTTRQVKELMNLMGFESSKLELAKHAFDRTVDKENYFRVNDAFTFESSISELDAFIRQG